MVEELPTLLDGSAMQPGDFIVSQIIEAATAFNKDIRKSVAIDKSGSIITRFPDPTAVWITVNVAQNASIIQENNTDNGILF